MHFIGLTHLPSNEAYRVNVKCWLFCRSCSAARIANRRLTFF